MGFDLNHFSLLDNTFLCQVLYKSDANRHDSSGCPCSGHLGRYHYTGGGRGAHSTCAISGARIASGDRLTCFEPEDRRLAAREAAPRRYKTGVLLLAAVSLLTAQAPTWKEFSIGPTTGAVKIGLNNVRQGVFHANSISLNSLIGIATNVGGPRVLGPGWMETEHYAVAAELSDESHLRLRTRSQDDASIAEEFRSLLMQELVRRFHLEYHREIRDTPAYTLRLAEGSQATLRASTARERGRFNLTNYSLTHSVSLDARGVTFRMIANWLQGQVRQPVMVDPALPEGAYDFRLKWKANDRPSLAAALKDQVGLELFGEPRNQEYLVVDRIERPGPPPPAPWAVPVAASADSAVTFTPAQLRRDLQVLRDALQEGHPGIYRYTAKAELDRAFDGAATQLVRPMTALEFYRVLAPVVARIKCGHTSLRPGAGIQQRLAAEPLIPVETAILGGKVYVARDFSEGGHLGGAEILSINDVPIDQILASMLAVVHGDGDSPTAGPYQLSHACGFARNLYLIAGLQSPFKLWYAAGGKIAETQIAGLTLKAMREVEPIRYPQTTELGNATWRLLDGGSIGALKIASFDGKAEGGVPLSEFFERVFTELREKSVSKLILDVRDNGGGEDELGRRLFAYFADRPFRYYRDLVVNKLSFRFFKYVPGRDPLANARETVQRGADGKYRVVGHPNWGTQQPAAPHFGGKVVVLMNGGSFSTTCEFLATLHNRGGAAFVGEETAGGYYGNASGAEASLVLPNSKLILPVQLVGYYLAIEGDAQGAHGIRPDYPVEYSIDDVLAGRDRAMEMALRVAGR